MAALLKHLKVGSRILDLGCGCGIPAAQELSQQHGVTGVDFSSVQIQRARQLVPEADFICADMTELGFPPQTFDAALSWYALIHVSLEEQHRLLSRIATWLKPHGWLPCTVGHRAVTDIEENWLGVPGGTMFWSHADQKTYERWLTESGFRIDESVFIPEGDGGHAAMLAQRVIEEACH